MILVTECFSLTRLNKHNIKFYQSMFVCLDWSNAVYTVYSICGLQISSEKKYGYPNNVNVFVLVR